MNQLRSYFSKTHRLAISAVVIILNFNSISIGGSGNFNPYLVTRQGSGGNTATAATTGTSFGTINSGTTWLLEGGEITSWADGGDSANGANLWFSVYRNNQSRPSFSSETLFFNSQNGNDKKWQSTGKGLDLTGSTIQIFGATYNGTYNLDYYFQAQFNWGSQYNRSGSSGDTTAPTSNFYTATYTLSGFDYYLDGSSGTTTQSTVGGGAATLTGSVGIGKFGSGATELNATGNNYTGRTLVAGGTLRTTAAGVIPDGSDVLIKSGATLDLNGNNETVASVGEYAISDGGTITLGGGILTINGSNKGSKSQNSITGSGGVNFSSSGTTYYLYGTQGYTGTTTVTAGTVQTSVAMSSGNFAINGGTFETFGANQISDSASVTLGGGTLKLGGSETIGNNGVSLTASTTSTVSPTTGNTLTIGGSLTGSGNLTKSDAGVVVVSVAHSSYSGTTTLGAGTLRLGADTAIGTGGLTINGGTLASSSGSARSVGNNVTMGGNVTLGEGSTGTGNLTLSGSMALGTSARTITVNNTSSTISGVVSGAGGSIIKQGSGSLTLSNDNNFSGGVQLNDGTLLVGHNNALGTGTLQVQFDVGSTKTLASSSSTAYTLNNNINVYNNLTIGQTAGGTGNLTLGGTFYLGDEVGQNRILTVNGTHTISGAVTGARGIVKQGGGTLSLSGANTSTGHIYIDDGVINLNGGSLGAGNIEIGAGAGGASAATLRVSSGSFSRGITVNSDTGAGARTIDFANTSGTATLSGTVALEKTAEVSVASGGTGALSGVISGAGGLTKSGSGSLTVSGNNTFDGNVTINGGKVTMSNGNALGDTGTISVSAGADLEVTGGITVARHLTLSAKNGEIRGGRLMSSGASKNTYSGTVAVNNSEFDVASGSTLDVTGKISGTGTVTKTGAGELQLSNTGNDYSGITDVQNGTLTASTIANSSTASTIGSGSELKVGSASTAGTFKYTGSTASMNRTVTVGAAGGTINVNDSAATMTLNGTVTGSGNTLTKTGGGTLALGSGASVSLGTIAVQQGTLLLGAANQVGASTGAASSFNMSAGTTLKTAFDLTGNVLTLAGTSTDANTIFDFNSGSGNDFAFGSTTWYGGNLKLSNVAVGTVINFGTFTGNGSLTFNDFQSKVSFTDTSLQAQINFSGTSLTVAAIPEPRVYAAAAGLILLIGWAEFKRRRGKKLGASR